MHGSACNGMVCEAAAFTSTATKRLTMTKLPMRRAEKTKATVVVGEATWEEVGDGEGVG